MITLLGQFNDATFYLATLTSFEAAFPTVPGCRFFTLIVFLDTEQISDNNAVAGFIDCALSAGARSVLCGGSAGSIVENAFDHAIICRGEIDKELYDPDAGDVIGTTCHDDEQIDDVMWQAYNCFACHDNGDSKSRIIVIALLANDSRCDEVIRLSEGFPESLSSVADRY